MTVDTQHVVLSIKGAEEIIKETDNIFLSKEKTIQFIQDGFQIHSSDLPYFFQINYDENFGWVVFLTSVAGGFEDHDETDKLYHQFEDVIDKINATYYADEDFSESNPFFLHN